MKNETEVKFYTPDLDRMHQKLAAVGAVLAKPRLYEYNLRYDDAASSLKKQDVVLRLRQDDRVRVTYKAKATRNHAVSTRLELETEVADFEMMDAIFRKLGYDTSLIYEKYRTTYHLHATEIVVDEMPYGNFIEIEGEEAAIEAIIERLGLSESPRIVVSYNVLFKRVKQALNLTFRDMTFDNFAGIDVPCEAFGCGEG